MAYTKQTWVNNETLVDEDRMNHIENGIYQNAEDISEINQSLTDFLIVTIYTFDEITLSGQLSNSGMVSLTVTPPTGYTNIGVVGINTDNGNILCGRSYLYNSTTVRAAFISVSSTSLTTSPKVYVLQMKS